MDNRSDQLNERIQSLEKGIAELNLELHAKNRALEVENALECVRSRAMLMKQSDELKEVIQVVYEQFVKLGIKTEHAGFILNFKENEDMHIWLADKNEIDNKIIIPYFDSPHWNSFKKAKANGSNFFANKLNHAEKNKFYRDLFKQVEGLSDDHLEVYLAYPALAISTVLLDNIGLYIENFSGIPYTEEENAILLRFGQVFQQAYTRFLDLQKVEAQAREAKIEAALERIRSRSMAMFDSEELGDVASLLYKELINLGISNFFNCGFMLVKEEEGEQYGWLTQPGGDFEEKLNLPYPGDTILKNRLKAWKAKQPVFFQKVGGKALSRHLEYVASHSHSQNQVETIIPFMPDPTYFYCGNFSEGYLHIITSEELGKEAEAIIARFTKVFEQAYTRFLDLQKAEAQAREAEIELALERVRAKTMAMQKSEELRELVFEYYKQIHPFGFAKWGFEIKIAKEDKSGFYCWISPPGARVQPEGFNIPTLDHWVLKKYWSAYERQIPILSIVNSGDDKRRLAVLLLERSEMKNLPEDVKTNIMETEYVHFTVAAMRFGLLKAVDMEPVVEKDSSILQRFAKVFEQTYTRFLDLQKAEAQAREAQIEASLERVRSRSLTMIGTEEFLEVAAVVYEELNKLEITSFESCGFNIYDEEKEIQEIYNFHIDLKMLTEFQIPMKGDQILDERYMAWKRKDNIFYQTVGGKALDVHLSYAHQGMELDASSWIEKFDFPDPAHYHFGNFAQGYLHIISSKELTTEQKAILGRFAKVFEQAYTRFLDLRKAEEQAREAKIEAALERIRSKAMAMRAPDDLKSVAIEVRRQIDGLGQIEFEAAVVHLYKKGSPNFESLAASPDPSGKIITHHSFFPVKSTRETQQMMANYWAGKKDYTIELNDKQARIWQKIVFENNPEQGRSRHENLKESKELGQSEFWNFADFSGGSLLLVTHAPLATKNKELLQRSAKVFDLAYRRYQDLVIAEEQAREAQIEAALERVRSISMAMQSSNELQNVVTVVFKKLQELNFGLDGSAFIGIPLRESREVDMWIGDNEEAYPTCFRLPNHESLPIKDVWNARQSGEEFISKVYSFEKKNHWFQFAFEQTDLKMISADRKKWILEQEFLTQSFAIAENSLLGLHYHFEKVLSKEDVDILKRFSKVFEQSYTRFLDLQKAETQAREAQIEAALERVRASTMAMHKSQELSKIVSVMYKEMELVGLAKWGCNIMIFHEDSTQIEFWLAEQTDTIHTVNYFAKGKEHSVYRKLWNHWKKQGPPITLHHQDAYKREFDEYWLSKTDFKYLPDVVKKSVFDRNEVFLNYATMRYGMLNAISYVPVNNEMLETLARFAKVFEQSYTRFLDLQKAEAQAKEAVIEATLERVRAKAMAMHSSSDLLDTTAVLISELNSLNIHPARLGIAEMIPERKSGKIFTTQVVGQKQNLKLMADITLEGNATFEDIFDHWKNEKEYFPILKGKVMTNYYRELNKYVEVKHPPKGSVQYGLFMFYEKVGIYAWADQPYEEDVLNVFRKYLGVLGLTYQRYKDLKDAENRAKEAQREASLDRVRAVIASMRTAEDLQKITPLIWQELTTLGVPFFRCGVFIINESTEQVQVFLTTSSGESLAAMNLPYGTSDLMDRTIIHWRGRKILKQEWTREQFVEWTQSIVDQGYLKDKNTYQGGQTPPEHLALHFVPFAQGMLYVGSEEILDYPHLELVQSLAEAFAVAYARYEDFNKLESANTALENTLENLKSTQKQLIQSEKMASLGELTAGIAHEIQNPLNFVNNFSEVSSELMDEMNEEIEKGDLEEAKFIAKDIKQNLEKINHHGKRADAIVKGMLQHSRKSSAEKEPTDINKLADEYLRLAYHGLRAKDKGFNADFKTDLDPSLPKINVIPQDIGRVLLNLINNAFYAANEKAKMGIDGHQPLVTVSTAKVNDHIVMKVADNGNGIPEQVKAKIFQPFFTTKPTGQGTGLGLSLSYDIVKAHGGTISVESTENIDTEFIITLSI